MNTTTEADQLTDADRASIRAAIGKGTLAQAALRHAFTPTGAGRYDVHVSVPGAGTHRVGWVRKEGRVWGAYALMTEGQAAQRGMTIWQGLHLGGFRTRTEAASELAWWAGKVPEPATPAPATWATNADGSLVCPHRDLSVCSACAGLPGVTEVVGAHFLL